jgi:hypothetical protein
MLKINKIVSSTEMILELSGVSRVMRNKSLKLERIEDTSRGHNLDPGELTIQVA